MENNDLISTTSNIINVNEETFMSEVIEASNTKPVIVDFWAPWCEPCKTLTPLLEDAVKNYGQDLILAKIDIDQNQNEQSKEVIFDKNGNLSKDTCQFGF